MNYDPNEDYSEESEDGGAWIFFAVIGVLLLVLLITWKIGG